jgi:hypothetical protein
MRSVLGIDVSQSDVINAGLVELEKRYPSGGEAEANTPAKRTPKKK